jgi:hypothetical protein
MSLRRMMLASEERILLLLVILVMEVKALAERILDTSDEYIQREALVNGYFTYNTVDLMSCS